MGREAAWKVLEAFAIREQGEGAPYEERGNGGSQPMELAVIKETLTLGDCLRDFYEGYVVV